MAIMLVQDKIAVIYGGSGAIGGAAARVLAREGAQLVLGGRNAARLEAVASDIRAAGGVAETFLIDVLDEQAVAAHAAALAAKTGGIDLVLNATSFVHDLGTRIDTLSVQDFMHPIDVYMRSLFNIAKAVVPHMGGSRAGVILTVNPPAGRMAIPGHLGHSIACAGTELFTRVLATELGPRNVRVLGVMSHAISDAPQAGSYTTELFRPQTEAAGLSVAEWLGGAAAGTLLKRLPTLSQIAETIAFLASDHAGAMTATQVNMTAGVVFQ